jgi:hypothetical protein
MKTRFVLILIMAVLAVSVYAQKIELARQVTRDEVPMPVLVAFQKDFPNLTATESGIWKLYYTEDLKTKKLTPRLYEFSFRKDGERVEINYKPTGILDHVKGIEAPTPISQP